MGHILHTTNLSTRLHTLHPFIHLQDRSFDPTTPASTANHSKMAGESSQMTRQSSENQASTAESQQQGPGDQSQGGQVPPQGPKTAAQLRKHLIEDKSACAALLGLSPDDFVEWLASDSFKPFFQKLWKARKQALAHGEQGPHAKHILNTTVSRVKDKSAKVSPGNEPFNRFDILDWHVWFIASVVRENSIDGRIFHSTDKTELQQYEAILIVLKRLTKLASPSEQRAAAKRSSNKANASETAAVGIQDESPNVMSLKQKKAAVAEASSNRDTIMHEMEQDDLQAFLSRLNPDATPLMKVIAREEFYRQQQAKSMGLSFLDSSMTHVEGKAQLGLAELFKQEAATTSGREGELALQGLKEGESRMDPGALQSAVDKDDQAFEESIDPS